MRVVVAGGGIAALEALLALREHGRGRLDVTLIAPEDRFVLRPWTVGEPFGRGAAPELWLRAVCAEMGATFRRAAVVGVDGARKAVRCTDGADVPYDALLLALGARPRAAYEHALTFGLPGEALAPAGLLRDLEERWSRSVAFVLPPGSTWPLPLYELALMTAEDVGGMGAGDVELHLVTPEAGPLALFGDAASAAVGEMLDDAGVTVHAGVAAEVPAAGIVWLGGGERLEVDRIVTLPELHGPALPGLPPGPDGFIPVDDAGRVPGLDGVWAAGDATDRPIKQGGLACHQADAAAAGIARAAGLDVPEAAAAPPVLRGRLLTGRRHRDRFLRRDAAGTEVSWEPLWWPPAKVAARHLDRYLATRGDAPGGAPAPEGLEVVVAP